MRFALLTNLAGALPAAVRVPRGAIKLMPQPARNREDGTRRVA